MKDKNTSKPFFFQSKDIARMRHVVMRALANLDTLQASISKNIRAPGGGRKPVVPEISKALFSWFVDIRVQLKGRISMKLFNAKCEELFEAYKKKKKEEGQELSSDELNMKFSKSWIRAWKKKYRVSLRKPNKRYALSKEVRRRRILQFLKNIYRVRWFFNQKYGVDPPIISGDQMPLHRLESSISKTLSFTGSDCNVKEQYMHSRERVTAMTFMASSRDAPLPEFIFKGKGKRVKLEPPKGVNFQWSDSGSYRQENVLKTISTLPTRIGPIERNLPSGHKKFAIMTLDDFSAHLNEEVKQKLFQKGYILVLIGGGITGDIQPNDTALHHHLKENYREIEQNLLTSKLVSDPEKVPAITRNEVMKLCTDAYNNVDVDHSMSFKTNWLTNKFDGSEDYLVSARLMALIGDDFKAFRAELMESQMPEKLNELRGLITPPEGVRRKEFTEQSTSSSTAETDPQEDEGTELLDCQGSELDEEEESDLSESDSEMDTTEQQESVIIEVPDYTIQEQEPPSEQIKLMKVLEEYQDLLNKHRADMTMTEALPLLPFFNSVQLHISDARTKLKKDINLDQSMASYLITSSTMRYVPVCTKA